MQSAHCRVLHAVAGSYYSSSNMCLPLTCNDLLATVYFQWSTCTANFHFNRNINRSITYEILSGSLQKSRLTVKAVGKLDENLAEISKDRK